MGILNETNEFCPTCGSKLIIWQYENGEESLPLCPECDGSVVEDLEWENA